MTLTTDARVQSPPSPGALIRRKVRSHTRVVHLMRWLMPAAIVAILAVIGSFLVAQAMKSAAARPKETPTEIRMINPHFIGRDSQGRSFNISAHQASREDADMQRVDLTDPVLVLDQDGPQPKTMTADRGVYDENTRLLRLVGHVRVDDAAASTVATQEAVVDTKAGTVSGAGAIAAASANGSIQAGSYSASDKGQKIILRGGVHGELKGR